MNTDELTRSDREAMLIVGTFAHSLSNPESWERFTDRLFDEWGKRHGIDLAAIEGRNAPRRLPQAQDPLTDVRSATSDNDAAATPDANGGPPASE